VKDKYYELFRGQGGEGLEGKGAWKRDHYCCEQLSV
jgi:hypothetical protein